MSKNKVRRYRLNDVQVVKLGLTPNQNNRYRLTKEQEIELLKLRQSQSKIKRLFFDI